MGLTTQRPGVAALHGGFRPATLEEVDFLRAAGAATNVGWLISVDVAISACGSFRGAAPLLAAMAGIPKLQPHTATVDGAAGEQLLAQRLGHAQQAQRAAAPAQESARSGAAAAALGARRKRKLDATPRRALGVAGVEPDQAAATAGRERKRLRAALVHARALAASGGVSVPLQLSDDRRPFWLMVRACLRKGR